MDGVTYKSTIGKLQKRQSLVSMPAWENILSTSVSLALILFTICIMTDTAINCQICTVFMTAFGGVVTGTGSRYLRFPWQIT